MIEGSFLEDYLEDLVGYGLELSLGGAEEWGEGVALGIVGCLTDAEVWEKFLLLGFYSNLCVSEDQEEVIVGYCFCVFSDQREDELISQGKKKSILL